MVILCIIRHYFAPKIHTRIHDLYVWGDNSLNIKKNVFAIYSSFLLPSLFKEGRDKQPVAVHTMYINQILVLG